MLVDDHMVIRKGLIALLGDLYMGLGFFEAADDETALKVLRGYRIDVVVMDLQIPGADAIQLIELISIKYPSIYILVFSMLPEAVYGRRIFKAGASGYLGKDAPIEEVKRAFDQAFARKKYMSQHLVELFAQQVSNKIPPNPFEKLSHREFEIIHLLLNGTSISSIGKRLNIKPSTVGTYKSRIFEKLNVSSLFELNRLAVLYGVNSSSILY